MLCLETTTTIHKIRFVECLTRLLGTGTGRFLLIHRQIHLQKFCTDALENNNINILLGYFNFSSGLLQQHRQQQQRERRRRQPIEFVQLKSKDDSEKDQLLLYNRNSKSTVGKYSSKRYNVHLRPPQNTSAICSEKFSISKKNQLKNINNMINLPDLREMALKFIDIGANLTDPMFQGKYHGLQKHQPDLDIVLHRAWTVGMEKMIISVGSLKDSDAALEIANQDDRLYITMGCHPTRCHEFDEHKSDYYDDLCKKIEENRSKVIAIGECGLDYDRLQFCEGEIQRKYFEKQLNLAVKYDLPLFLHCRNAHKDFVDIIERNIGKVFPKPGGVVHSFDGTIDEAKKLIEMGFYIGINGCSLKTIDNLNVVKEIPIDKIMIETDSPWCGIRPTHASAKMVATHFPMVKKREKWTRESLIDGRSEPCQIIQVVEVIASVKREPVEDLADIFYSTTVDFFFKK